MATFDAKESVREKIGLSVIILFILACAGGIVYLSDPRPVDGKKIQEST